MQSIAQHTGARRTRHHVSRPAASNHPTTPQLHWVESSFAAAHMHSDTAIGIAGMIAVPSSMAKAYSRTVRRRLSNALSSSAIAYAVTTRSAVSVQHVG
jgi:hypothetical protein